MQNRVDKRMSLEEAVDTFVRDGCSITFGALAAREPMAAAYEIVRQKKKDLTFITESTCDAAEIIIAGGCVRRAECAYIWGGGLGAGYNYRRAVEHGIPLPLEVEEYSNLSASLRFLAGSMGVPFMLTKSLLGSDILNYNPRIKVIDDPYGSGPVAVVPAAQPDVSFIHVQRADKNGNAQIWGMQMNDDLVARASKQVVLTCEEIIPTREIRRNPNMTTIPSYCVSAVIEVPFGSHPVTTTGYYWMDQPFRGAMVEASKSRAGIEAWMEEWIFSVKDFHAYKEKVGVERLAKLQEMEQDNYRIPELKEETL